MSEALRPFFFCSIDGEAKMYGKFSMKYICTAKDSTLLILDWP